MVDDNTVLHGMFTLLEKVCCCEIGILYSKIAHILQQGINGLFLTLLMKGESSQRKLRKRSKEERKRIINDFRYYHQQQKHPSELSTVPKLVYHASKKITCSRSKISTQERPIQKFAA